MKITHLKIVTIVFCLFVYQMGMSQNNDAEKKKIEERAEDFAKFFKAFDWTDYTEVGRGKRFECRADAIPRLKRMRNPLRNAGVKEYLKTVSNVESFVLAMGQAVDGENFDKVKEREGSFMDYPDFKRDKMIEKIQTASTSEQFIDYFGTKLDQTKVKFSEAEKKELVELFNTYKMYFTRGELIAQEAYSIGDCKYGIGLFARPYKVESNKVTWRFHLGMTIYCNCQENSSNVKLKRINVYLEAEFVS